MMGLDRWVRSWVWSYGSGGGVGLDRSWVLDFGFRIGMDWWRSKIVVIFFFWLGLMVTPMVGFWLGMN